MNYNVEEVEMLFLESGERFEKTVANLGNELSGLRAGRANARILDKITVDYYGTQSPLNQVANITTPEARLLVVSPWDASLLKTIEKAIIDANVGIMPNNDGKVIRLVFPELTEERRRALSKDVRTLSENAKVAIRNIRRDAMDTLKKYKKDSVITEDDLSAYEKEIEKIVASKIETIEKISAEKEKEIMSV